MNISGRVGVIGIGSWGTAMANEFARSGKDTVIYTHEPEVALSINESHTNEKYLDGFTLDRSLKATTYVEDIKDCNILINCIPTQYISGYYKDQNISLNGKFVVNGSKGVENNSLRLISEIFNQDYGVGANTFAHFAGPSHAELLLSKDLTSVVCSSNNSDLSEYVIETLSSNHLRVYKSQDVIGTQIGGALKNVIAIAAGIIDGFDFGENAKAALITRGLAEITRLGVSMGANPLTFSGLTGIGDLIVTCMSKHSRNWQFGYKLSEGKNVNQIKQEMLMVAEGVSTSISAVDLSHKYNVEMPIVKHVNKIIFGEEQPQEIIMKAIQKLMTRTNTTEVW